MARRTERLVLVFGVMVVVVLLGVVGSGIYLRRAYRPTPAATWTDINAFDHQLHTAQIARHLHRALAPLAAVAVLFFVVIYAIAGTQPDNRAHGRRWVIALGSVLTALIGPPILAWVLRVDTPLRRWELNHETPGYALIVAVAYAVIVRPRAQQTRPGENER